MSLWKHPDFMKLWTSQTVSEIGSRITREGLPMGAVLLMGVSPFIMSGLSLATQLPASLLGMLIGVWVDRLPRRPLMAFADLARALLLLTIPIAALTHVLQLWMFFIVAALTGILSLLFDVSYQAYLPWLINRKQLMEGNSKLGVTASTAEVIGPGLTGMLVQALTAPIAIVFDALSYLFSAVLIWSIRRRESRTAVRQNASVAAPDLGMDVSSETHGELHISNWRQEMKDGLMVLRHHHILLALAGVTATSGLASSAIFVLDTLYALKTLHLSAFLFGLTVTMGGIGSLLGAAVSSRIVRRLGVGRTLIVMLIVRGVTASCWVFAGGPVWRTMGFLLAWQLFGDLSGTIYDILDTTIRQSSVQDNLLGRVNATIRVAEVGFTAIGALLSGVLSEIVGIRETMLFAAVGMTLATLWVVFSPLRKMRVVPIAVEESLVE